MLEPWRIRAILAQLLADLPDPPSSGVGAIERAVADLASGGDLDARPFGVARDGTPLVALGIAPPAAPAAPAVLVVGVPRGDSPAGAWAILALARHLRADPALRAALGVRWWLVPCLDPAGARQNAPWWEAPLTVEGFARGIVVSPPDEQPDTLAGAPPPEQRALRDLIAAIGPQIALFLYDAPAGGCALFARAGLWHGRDFDRLLAPLGLPLDLGGAFGPVPDPATGVYPLDATPEAAADPYERFRATVVHPVGTALPQLGPPDLAVGAVVAPLFADYHRRERDRTPAPATRQSSAAEGIRLWREWFAFGRTALDLLAPHLAATALAQTPAYRALLAALRGADIILAEGLRWPALVPDPAASATVAATFAHGDAIRLARLARLATLVRCLAPASPRHLADARDRALETQTRWIDELAGPGNLRPMRRDHAIATHLAAIFLALP